MPPLPRGRARLSPVPPMEALVRLQRAATPEGVWQSALAFLRETMPFNNVLLGLSCVDVLPVFIRLSKPVPDVDHYLAKLSEVAPLKELVQRKPGLKVSRMSDEMPAGQSLEGWPFYETIMKPEGWCHAAALLFWQADGKFIGQFSATRRPDQGGFTDQEMALLASYHPHLEAAIDRLIEWETVAASRSAMVESARRLPVPLVLVDRTFRLDYANQAGCEALWRWQHGTSLARSLTTRKAALPRDIAEGCRRLRDDFDEAIRRDDLGGFISVAQLIHADEPTMIVSVRLLHSLAKDTLQPMFSLEFRFPREMSPESSHAQSLLARLTISEREVARLAGGGYDNPGIARRLGISVTTVRTHLRNIFRKLSLTSRGQLAPLIAKLEPGIIALANDQVRE